MVVSCREVTDGQIGPSSTSSDLTVLDESRIYPLTGPIEIRGARPGDTLAVEVLDIRTADWGWAAILPGEGLLPDEFPEPYVRHFDLTGEAAFLRDDIGVPVRPFLGTMGVCPAGATARPVMPPGRFGGNVDIRHLARGSTLYLPVELEGGLFSCGDAHAAQGDGEVCVTAIETPATATLRFTIERGWTVPAPQFRSPGRALSSDVFGTTGVGPDLFVAAREATRAMIEHLARSHDLSREDAYVLSSLCVDLHISEIVDAGEYVVSALLPLSVFR